MKLTSKRMEVRVKNAIKQINRELTEYIKNGCNGTLYLRNSPITKLPGNLTHVNGGLSIVSSKITKLPDNLIYIDRFLDVRKTEIKSLSQNLFVNDFIDISHTQFEELPYGINCDVWCYNTPLSKKYTASYIKDLYGVKGYVECEK